MVVKTFRGRLADGDQDHIRLGTNDGKTGYKIVKFETISSAPGTTSVEQITKIYKTEQTTIDATADFSDPNLLAIAYWSVSDTSQRGMETIIFGSDVFNQDIFVTYKAGAGSEASSYYFELEVIPLTEHAAEITTLKDIRARNTT